MRLDEMHAVVSKRPRLLWMVLGAMLLVSVFPLGLYHRQVLRLSQEKLTDTESVQQTEVTRSVGEEIQLFDANLYQQLISERQILALTDLLDRVSDPARQPQITRLLENFVASNPDILYLTAVGRDGKGTGAGNFRADQDPFVGKALQRAFSACSQSVVFRSDPLALGPDNQPAFVMAIPLQVNEQFSGMLAAVVSLQGILRRLEETSVRGRTVFVVDHNGRIMAHPDTRNFVPGADLRKSSYIVSQVAALPKDLRTTETVQRFTTIENGKPADMMGTYSTIPDLGWAVVAQRSLEQAREDAGVRELNAQALTFVLVVTFAALVLGYLFAVGISTPIRSLAASTRAISRGEFHQRTPVHGAAEIRELAETFNNMADDIENFIARLKQAAQKIASCFWARSACWPRPLTKKIRIREAIPTASRNTRLLHRTNSWAWLGRGARPPAHRRPAARRGQDRRGRPRAQEARRAHPRRVRSDEAASQQGRQHHAAGAAAKGHAAGHRAAPRTRGRARLSLRPQGRGDSPDGPHHRGLRYPGRHDHQPPLPERHGA